MSEIHWIILIGLSTNRRQRERASRNVRNNPIQYERYRFENNDKMVNPNLIEKKYVER
jgi:hypothetical protein